MTAAFQLALISSMYGRRIDLSRRGPLIRWAHQRQENLIDNLLDSIVRQGSMVIRTSWRARSVGSDTIRGVRRAAAISPRSIARPRMFCMTSGFDDLRPQMRPHICQVGMLIRQVPLHVENQPDHVRPGTVGHPAKQKADFVTDAAEIGHDDRVLRNMLSQRSRCECGAARPASIEHRSTGARTKEVVGVEPILTVETAEPIRAEDL